MRQVEIRQTEIEGIASFVQGDSCVTEYFATHSKMGLMRTYSTDCGSTPI